MKVFYILSLFFFSSKVFSFPEMLRHGYTSCITCHVSPSGGGITTPYGKALSKEVLSIWSKTEDDDEEEGYSRFLAPTEHIIFGGNVRSINVYRNKPIENHRFIVMQADIEAAFLYENWKIVATAGREEFPVADRFVSRRHYLSYQLTESISLRGGRFQHAFGLNTPDHTLPTKEDLGWSHALSGESYNLELAMLKENYDVYVTAIIAHPEGYRTVDETGFSFKGSYIFQEKYRAGLSFFASMADNAKRFVTGPFAVIAFSEKFFLLSEVDFQFMRSSLKNTNGMVYYHRLNYEMTQGLHFYASSDLSYLDFKNDAVKSQGIALGSQIFPIDHFEFNLQWHRTKRVTQKNPNDVYWLMSHFYF